MKRVRTISVDSYSGERIRITVKWTEKANYTSENIEKKFDNLVDDVYQVLAKSYHVFAIKVSK